MAGTAFPGAALVAGAFALTGVGIILALFIGAGAGALCVYAAGRFDDE